MESKNKNTERTPMTLEEYEFIINSSPMMIVKIDTDYRIRYVNETTSNKADNLFGSLLGKNIIDLGVEPNIAKEAFNNYREVFATGKPKEFSIEFSDGESKGLYRIYVTPDLRGDGKIENLILYVEDITSQKKIEDERDYFFNFSIDLFAIHDLNGNFIKINPSWSDTLGLPDKDIIGKNWTDFVLEEDKQESLSQMQNLKKGKIIVGYETRFSTTEGQTKWLEWNSIPIKEKHIVVSVVRDITSFKEFETKLKSSEKKYREVVETAMDIIFSIDLKGNITFANAASQNITEYSSEELLNMNVKELIDNDYKEQLKINLMKQYLSGEKSNLTEYSITTKSGQSKWFSQNSTLRYDNHDNPVGFDIIARDITKQINVEYSLLESREQLRNIVNSTNDAILQIENDGTISDANDTAFELLKSKEDKLIGSDFRSYIEDKPSLMNFELFLQEFENRKIVNGLLNLTDSQGNILKFNTTGIEFKREGKLHLLLFMSNITSLKRAQDISQVLYNIARQVNFAETIDELFIEAHEEIRSVLDSKNLIFAQYDKDNDRIYFPYFKDEKDDDFEIENVDTSKSVTAQVIRNKSTVFLKKQQLLEFYGTDKHDRYGTIPKVWLGVPLLVEDEIFGAIIVQSYENEFAYDIQDVRLLESIAEQLALAISKIRSQQKLIQLNKNLEIRVSKRTEQLEKTLEDLHFENEERKKTQYELHQAKDELDKALEQEKELNILKSKFISMVSHEYRTPLTVIMSSVNLLDTYRHKMSAEQIDKQLQNITASVKSMSQLLDDVLMMGKAESTSLNHVHINVNMLISDIIHNIKFIDNHAHNIEFIAEKEFEMFSDKKLIGHIMNNLISNAVKYSEDGTTVTVKIDQTDKETIFQVIDQGIGIPDEDLENIFEAFYRSNNVGSIEGTGLGMSIVKQAVESLEGIIEIDSGDSGTAITIKVPIIEKDTSAT